MPIYTYECDEHGICDVFQRGIGPESHLCPACGQGMTNVLTAPARVDVKLDWNDKASDYQRDPYTQAKAQLTNISRTAADRGESQTPITEEAIQVGAKAIDESARHPRPDPQEQQLRKIRGK